jgi:hypothetical protein
MPESAERRAKREDFEIACCRLHVQDRLSTSQIADRLRTKAPAVCAALKRCDIVIDKRHTWAW